jgi:hypothetical protein
MSFDEYADSADEGAPFKLFKFNFGPGADDFLAYTDAERPFALPAGAGQDIYSPLAIEHSDITTSAGSDRSEVEISAPSDCDLSKLFRNGPPPVAVRVVIYEGEYGDVSKEVRICFAGKLISRTIEGVEAKFRCEPDSVGLQRTGLRRMYQHTCGLRLFGPKCAAARAAATRATTIAAISGADISFPAGWTDGTDVNAFVNGIFAFTGSSGVKESVSILAVLSATSIRLDRRPKGLSVGDSVDVIFGCDKTETGCALHNNLANFGGYPDIPTANPFGFKNNYY